MVFGVFGGLVVEGRGVGGEVVCCEFSVAWLAIFLLFQFS
jgi:hypothetical protein